MRKLQHFTVGWINTNIRAVVEAGLLSQFNWVLITSIDSISDLSAIRGNIARIEARCALLGSGLVVPGESMVRLASDQNLFTGFDELWAFAQRPSVPKPNDLSIAAPYNFETDLDSVSPRLVPWMAEAECELGLGDGIGLNYVTQLEGLVSVLERSAD